MPIASPFQSPRTTLRTFEPADLSALHTYLNHPDLAGRRYVPWEISWSLPLSQKQVEQILSRWAGEKEAAHFAVVLRETGELIGHADCDWDWDPHAPGLSVVIAPARQRRGLGSEVMGLLLRYLFEETPAHNVSCWYADWNEPARLFLLRHGFTESGRQRRAGIHQGRYYDMRMADLLRPEWLAGQGGDHAA